MEAEFFVHNLGCKVNRVESDIISAALLSAGGVPSLREEARVIVVNTCTVTREADAKTRKAIRRAAQAESNPWVIATGCAIAIEQAAYESLGDRVIAEPDRQQALKKALELLGLEQGTGKADSFPIRQGEGFNTRLGIKIQDGCDNACSYCIVHVARGAATSTPLSSIAEQTLTAESRGVREIILTGVNIGAYSSGNGHLAALIKELLASTSKLRIRLSSLEPQHADDELLELMAKSQGRLCAHLHLPLQSGCDHTLREMGRLYDTSFYATRVQRARALMPRLALTTDLIVGFPGENDRDFEASLAFCESMSFSRMHVFRYSQRPGTPSAQRTDQVPAPVSADRAERMRELAASMQRQDMAERIGTVEAVLIEKEGRGTSESYHHVETSAKVPAGSLIPMQFIDCRDTLLTGLPIDVL